MLPVEQLAELLAGQLQMQGDEGAVAVERPKVLDELSIDGIVAHLKKIMVSEDSKSPCTKSLSATIKHICTVRQSVSDVTSCNISGR